MDLREAQDCVVLKFKQKQRMKAKKPIKIVGSPYRTLKVFLHLLERISDLTNSVSVRHLDLEAEATLGPALGFL
jgi:hypothetical protein